MNDNNHIPHRLPPLIEVGDVILSTDILTECFCCDLDACGGICCVEGDAGAPLTLDEVGELENVLDEVWPDLSAAAQAVIDQQGVAYTDRDGDLVTSIVNGKDCVFTCYNEKGCCFCATEKAFREGRTSWCKPISCYLYPIREKRFAGGLIGLNYHRWNVCSEAVKRGRELNLPVYKFLRDPLIKRFGEEWYKELEGVAEALLSQKRKNDSSLRRATRPRHAKGKSSRFHPPSKCSKSRIFLRVFWGGRMGKTDAEDVPGISLNDKHQSCLLAAASSTICSRR